MKAISDSSSSESPLADFPARSGPEKEEEQLRKIGVQRAGAQRFAHFGRWRSSGVLCAAFLVMAGTGIIINVLGRWADEDRRLQRSLVQLEANAREMDALEWKTIFKGKLDGELAERLQKIRSAMDAGIGKLRPLEPGLPQLRAVAGKYETYSKLVDEEFRFLADGKIKEAQEVDAAKVDPAFEDLHQAIAETENAFDKQASRTLALVRAGTFLVLLAAVGFVAALFWHDHQRRRAAEVSAAEQRVLNLLRAITEGTTDAIFAKDRDGRYLMINSAGARLVGKTPEEMIGLDDTQLFSEETRTRIIERDRALMRTGETRTDEDITTTLAGRSRVFLTTKGALHDSGGAIIGLFGVSRDITERKQAEEALAAQVLRYKTLMETSKDSIYVVDEKGDLQEANAAFLRRRGYTAADVKGLNIADWDARWDREQLLERLRQLIGKSTVFETRHRCTDGSIFDVEVCATSVRIAGKALFFAVTRDISERKKADQALRESETRFRSYFELGLIGVAITSPAKGYLEVNDELCRILGYERSELLRKTWAELTHPDDLAADVAHFNRVLAGEIDGYSRGKRFIRKDGKVIDTTISVKCLRRADGSIDYFVGLLQDITERKRAEQALRESEERFRELAENIDDIFWLTDLQHKKVLYISPAYERIWGRTCESLYASVRSWTDSLHPEDRERILALRGDGHLQEMPDMTYRIVRPDGSLRWIHQREFPVKDAEGKVVRVAGIVEDITERKRVEQSQRESRLRYETLVQSIDGIVWEADPQTFMFTFVSKQAERILGYPLEQWFGGPSFWPDHMHPADRDWAVKFCVDATARGEDHQFEYRMISADGREVWLNDIVTLHIAPDQSVILRGLMVDITERKRADQALRETEIRFRQLAENISQAFWLSDVEGTLIHYIGPAYEKISGRSCESLYANPASWLDFVHPEDRERIAADERSQSITGQHDRSYRIVRPDGSVRWIHDRAFPVRDESGELIRVAGIAEDITERKEAEELVLRAREFYLTLLDKFPTPVWRSDVHAECNYFNQTWLEFTGRTMEQEWGQGWAEGVHPADLAACLRSYREAFDLRRPFELEYRLRRSDGEYRWILDYGRPFDDLDGQFAGYIGSCHDITERKLAEQRLRESETRFRQIAENIEEMFWITDLEGSNTIYISPAYERITGRSCESLYAAPKSWREYIHPEDRPRMEATFASDPGSTGDHTYRIVRPDGSIRWIRDRGFPVRDESGEVVRFAGIAEDITASKSAEEELQHVNEQLRVLSRRLFQVQEDERRHLARELHDEIGQALTAVKINLDSIEAVEGSAQSLRLKEASTILDNLLWQVRQISLDLHSSLIDDLGLAPALRSLLDQQARRAGLRTQFCAAEPLQNVDPGIQTTGFRIAQEAITNVLRHAKAQSLSVHLQTGGGKLRMKIVDDGTGFSLAEIERRDRQEGGFGLLGMKERAALVGGRVQIISSTHKGTRVEVSLPLNAADEAP